MKKHEMLCPLNRMQKCKGTECALHATVMRPDGSSALECSFYLMGVYLSGLSTLATHGHTPQEGKERE